MKIFQARWSLRFLVLCVVAVTLPATSRTLAVASGKFVTRSGSHLILDGHQFRFSGANIYWPVITEFGGDSRCADNQRTCRYTSAFEVEDALRMANAMGATVIRSHAAVSIGCGLCIQAAPGDPPNLTTMRHLDFFVDAARRQNIRLILPLVDNWHYFQGGIHDYAAPGTYTLNGLAPSASEKEAFFTSPIQIGYFEQHIALILNRVNSYTRLAYKDDPTILGWELGNEVLDAPYAWLSTITTYIKSIDHNHLVGFDQTVGHTGGLNPSSLLVPNLDFEDDHLYPPNMTTDRVNADAAVSAQHNKAYMLGEYNWTLPSVGALLSDIEKNPSVSGDLYWSLESHRTDFGTWDDGRFNGTYPGSTPARRTSFAILRAHAFAINGRAEPPSAIPPAPIIRSIVGSQIIWRGAAPAISYTVARSSLGRLIGYAVVCKQCASDYALPWSDASQPGGSLWYRLRGINASGKPGPFSAPYHIFVDPLDGWHGADLFFHSKGLSFDKTNPTLLGGDKSRAFRQKSKDSEFIIWRDPGVTSFQAVTYFWPGAPVTPFALFTSANGLDWHRAVPTISMAAGTWPAYSYTLTGLTGINYVKVVWPKATKVPWSPQLGRAAFTP